MTVHDSPTKLIANPREESLHLFCKQMLKSRLFKGFYKERCYIDEVKGYRDLIIVNSNEKDLKTILEDIEKRLRQFYTGEKSSIWIGISTTQSFTASTFPEICIWSELDDLSFDQYWFSIKSVRLRDNEIIVKLKPIRTVDTEPMATLNCISTNESKNAINSISLEDFLQVILNWGISAKQILYEFMSNDISKENLINVFKFLIVICISLLSFSVEAIKFIGIFTIRFMKEFRMFLVVATPIIMRIIDLFAKVIGGFYILLAMIWRDVKGGRVQPQLNQHGMISYNQQTYQRKQITHVSQKRI